MAATLFKTEGLKKLQGKFKKLPDKVQRKVSGQALKASATPVVKKLRKAAPVGPTGNLGKSMMTRVKKYKGGEFFLAIIGPRYGRKRGSTQAIGPHGHFVEFGTVKQPPRPFMRPVWDSERGNVQTKLGKELGKRIEREAAKR